MGLLTRRRNKPRIVKKRKPKGQKHVSVKQLDPFIRVLKFSLSYVSNLETLGWEKECLRKLWSIGS
jgi:hypothetical protein